MQHVTTAKMIPISQLMIPNAYASVSRRVDDDILRNSVQLTGVQQPLVVVQLATEQYLIVDGVRRRTVADSLGMAELPCIVDGGAEEVDDPQEYRNRIRFILGEHRQDLLPSQRATLIRKLQDSFGLNAKQVALYLGVTPATIANWTMINELIPAIRNVIDAGTFAVHTARAFNGMSDAGQEEIWSEHSDAIKKMSASRLHKWIRETYSPESHPQMYKNPDRLVDRLKRQSQPRKTRKRAKISVVETNALMKDVEARRIELEDKSRQVAEFEKDIDAAVPVIKALRDNVAIWKTLPTSVQTHFDEFADRYIV